MIIGGNKELVIDNIKKATATGELNIKVEVDDPDLSSSQKEELVRHYLKKREKIGYFFKNRVVRFLVKTVTWMENRSTEFFGMDNLNGLTGGAIITSNHFNALDNTAIRSVVKKVGQKRLYIVSQETNLAMPGFIGFIMNYADIIPITSLESEYMKNDFPKIVGGLLDKKCYILIYPEKEMWFNYRKPRPPKRGAYYYAAKLQVPVISCFVEIKDLDKKETEDFHKIKYIVYVLPVIYPDPNKSVCENSMDMMKKDYEQKKEAYEKAYGKKLNYDFAEEDIAGWIPKNRR